MSLSDRQFKILNLLNQNDFLTVQKLSSILGVSEPTIRRDLVQLELEGSIQRLRGGAKLSNHENLEWSFSVRQSESKEAKIRIAQIAAYLVQNGDSMFLDSGSTSYWFAREILSRKNLTTISYGLKIVDLLSNNNSFESYIVCGKYDKKRTTVYGKGTSDYINQFHCSWTFVSTPAFDASEGTFTSNPNETSLKQAFRNNSDFLILLINSEKFDKRLAHKELKTEEIDLIVTEKQPSQLTLDLLKHKNIPIIWKPEQAQAAKKYLTSKLQFKQK